ncbi:hypothetical protein NIES37_37730 [Tolypothrix tenuis PCC 7101]|uniref:Uncharacterized protein n=1 Tax=Tolypothrix tenuis PCC 7101 TaxID=231146 RepID=A0A1Z4N274_9CYAN|nr:hypothetical protein NIES37_37730 [Tolypothrix tenuis PCC 7101]BAZ76288.1 hypothetical protein NIES50_48860 [Aulosira laxa NIES-50]
MGRGTASTIFWHIKYLTGAHRCQLKLKAIYGECCTKTLALIPSPLLPQGEGELNLLLPSPGGRGAGGEGETLQPSGFHVKLTPLTGAVPLQRFYLSQILF